METAESDPVAAKQPLGTRILGKLRRPTIPDLIAAAIFAVAGSLFVTSAIAGSNGDIRNDRTGGLRDSIVERATVARELNSQVEILTSQLKDLRNQSLDKPELNTLEQAASKLAPVAGLTKVVGPGLTVTLKDAVAPDPLPDGMTGDDYLIHQQDIQNVVNALWRGGANGITVMGVRLISTSAVRCVGNTVILQGRVYSPPFVIKAVGDPTKLERALSDDNSVQVLQEWVALVGLGYQQKRFATATLPAYDGLTQGNYATVNTAEK